MTSLYRNAEWSQRRDIEMSSFIRGKDSRHNLVQGASSLHRVRRSPGPVTYASYDDGFCDENSLLVLLYLDRSWHAENSARDAIGPVNQHDLELTCYP